MVHFFLELPSRRVSTAIINNKKRPQFVASWSWSWCSSYHLVSVLQEERWTFFLSPIFFLPAVGPHLFFTYLPLSLSLPIRSFFLPGPRVRRAWNEAAGVKRHQRFSLFGIYFHLYVTSQRSLFFFVFHLSLHNPPQPRLWPDTFLSSLCGEEISLKEGCLGWTRETDWLLLPGWLTKQQQKCNKIFQESLSLDESNAVNLGLDSF